MDVVINLNYTFIFLIQNNQKKINLNLNVVTNHDIIAAHHLQ